ncbi:ATP-grasp domain-containing protein [Alteromonas ponticola]|uniref:ATP-grasp domain-containing protein n=1 Tax=Alteromonas ponticola TaxID=2720613 RepID=A0ABX1R1U9_9ALTE|nr:ATP-grasp domain-containing protein [Alteromonas ponticola]NMH59047.1 ATP-grasp domain-containing protein [Alteromonas ponticola]
MEKKSVLIFDAQQRSALAATRSLGKRSDITVYTTDSTPEALAGASKYSSSYFCSPDPVKNTEQFITWLARIIDDKQIDFLLPVTEVSSRTLLENRDKLPSVKLPFAELDTVLALSDKNQLVELAKSLAIPVPESRVYPNASAVDTHALDYPCVLKPALSKVLVNNRWQSTQVHIVHTEAEFNKALEHAYFNHPFMLQQYIAGQGAGLFCYYQHGEAKAFFAHKRLREKPPSGGVSVLSESVAADAKVKEFATKLLDSVNWHGVAMVEFKVADDGTPYLMEINTRLWGSLQLSIDAGVNFPELLFDGEYADVPLTTAFKQGVQLRWLLGDLDNLYLNMRDKKQSIKDKLLHIGRFFTPRLSGRKHEVNRLDDMGPFRYELKKYFLGG